VAEEHPVSNPCLKCPTQQSCCRELHGLKVNEDEFSRLFAGKSDHLTVVKKGKLYELSSHGKGPCPNWDGHCQAYGTRPMDCDLYPYTVGNVFEGNGEVYATYHSRTECPLSDELLGPREKAEALIYNFLKATYGETAKVTVRYDEGAARVYHLARRAMAKAKRVLTGDGSQ
jgi:Fe-S-cluster containining protein